MDSLSAGCENCNETVSSNCALPLASHLEVLRETYDRILAIGSVVTVSRFVDLSTDTVKRFAGADYEDLQECHGALNQMISPLRGLRQKYSEVDIDDPTAHQRKNDEYQMQAVLRLLKASVQTLRTSSEDLAHMDQTIAILETVSALSSCSKQFNAFQDVLDGLVKPFIAVIPTHVATLYDHFELPLPAGLTLPEAAFPSDAYEDEVDPTTASKPPKSGLIRQRDLSAPISSSSQPKRKKSRRNHVDFEPDQENKENDDPDSSSSLLPLRDLFPLRSSSSSSLSGGGGSGATSGLASYLERKRRKEEPTSSSSVPASIARMRSTNAEEIETATAYAGEWKGSCSQRSTCSRAETARRVFEGLHTSTNPPEPVLLSLTSPPSGPSPTPLTSSTTGDGSCIASFPRANSLSLALDQSNSFGRTTSADSRYFTVNGCTFLPKRKRPPPLSQTINVTVEPNPNSPRSAPARLSFGQPVSSSSSSSNRRLSLDPTSAPSALVSGGTSCSSSSSHIPPLCTPPRPSKLRQDLSSQQPQLSSQLMMSMCASPQMSPALRKLLAGRAARLSKDVMVQETPPRKAPLLSATSAAFTHDGDDDPIDPIVYDSD